MGRFIDRSNVNGADNYARADVARLYLKATEGTGFIDGTFRTRTTQARRAGVKQVGYYHFARLGNPEAECDFFLNQIGKQKPGQLRPCLDLERGTVVQDRAWAERWVTHFHKRMGYYPALYGSTSLIAPLRAASKLLRKCPWWRAEYSVNDGRHHALAGGNMGAAAHQYTSVAHIPGISGNCDQSILLGPNALLVPSPNPVRRPVDASWRWAQWYMGLGPYKGHARVRRLRPHVPLRVPKSWWAKVRWYKRQGFKVNDK